MRNQRSLGLVVEGNATSSLILRLPRLGEDLGPIKAGALRVARRVSNFLRAGYAVSKYEELKTARIVLLRVPDAVTPRVVEEICNSNFSLKDLSFILCESCLASSVLLPLQALGASTATLTAIQSLRKNWFVVEGQMTAVRQIRKFLERNDATAFELRSGTKPLYFAAQLLASTLPLALLASAQQTLRSAGISGNQLHDLLEEMTLEMFRSFGNGMRVTFPVARTGCSPAFNEQHLQEVRLQFPQLGALLDEHLSLATRILSVDTDR